jgi:Methylase of chemotaxis methyl-accepting proteins
MPDYADMDPATLRQALELVYLHTGITMVPTKQSMLQTRLRQRLRALQLDSYVEYLQRVQEDAEERQSFIDVVTTHHTAFFRTPRVWRHVRDVFLPEWVEHHSCGTLRSWSAACSSGEEACSIAIMCEELRRQHPKISYEILGTDISAEVVKHADEGVYSGTTATGFRNAYPELFERYNVLQSAEQFQLAPELRKRMTYATHNLLDACSWKDRYDLIFLRNVLIYFKKPDIETIVRSVAPALRKDGLLIIGEAESLSSMNVPFEFVRPQIYRLRT